MHAKAQVKTAKTLFNLCISVCQKWMYPILLKLYLWHSFMLCHAHALLDAKSLSTWQLTKQPEQSCALAKFNPFISTSIRSTLRLIRHSVFGSRGQDTTASPAIQLDVNRLSQEIPQIKNAFRTPTSSKNTENMVFNTSAVWPFEQNIYMLYPSSSHG